MRQREQHVPRQEGYSFGALRGEHDDLGEPGGKWDMSGDAVERSWRASYSAPPRDWDFELELMGNRWRAKHGSNRARFPFDTNCPVATRSKKMDVRAETRAGGPQSRQREKMSCWRRAGRTAWSRRVSGAK